MQSKLVEAPKRYFAGKRCQMSLVNNQTADLWRGFMPRKKEINHAVGSELFSIEVYPKEYFSLFNPASSFEKWAAVEVQDKSMLLGDMEYLIVPPGLYVVFQYKGSPQEAPKFFAYIFKQWMPASDFELAHRPHFAVMGDKYDNESEDSEEEIWIPVKPKE